MSNLFRAFTENLGKLIQKFEADKAHYLSKGYSEAQARVDFITPFFKALGWDVENEAGHPYHQREVIVEKGETEGRLDYNFRLGGQTKLFVESKAPSESLDTVKHILQAKGYAWNTKQVFFVILTDFEEFRFYDASIRPDERKPDEGLLLKLHYTDYLKNAEKLWDFSKERAAAGSLEALLPRDRRTQRQRIPVDKAFLEEMTEWRSELARNIYKNNPDLTAKQLNEVVQRLLDRIVFIRIAEDRHIIEKNQLRDAVEQWDARGGKLHLREWLTVLFLQINEDFNGEIFKPHLCEQVRVDSEVLAKIIERLYPPKSPYRFDVIGVELLGSIYERYLGNTIRVTPKQVRVEEKPEVRKAGGVYYTPKYIVDYIVKNTVGKLIEGKKPKQIEKIRILDPACGSGSFLIGAFQCLIDYHVRYLTEHPNEAHIHPLYPDLLPDGNGGYRLSVRLKTKILKNNLYGVDIDPQAVEITMMSLYLKALEGEKSQLPPKQSLLPELKYNIICGNSLIGPDIYQQGNLFDEEERDRINAFDWHSDAAGFGQIMKQGGFACVIGNPPYIFTRNQGISETEKKYFYAAYRHQSIQLNTFGLFLERTFSLSYKSSSVGFITPNNWLTIDSFAPLRKLVLESGYVIKVVNVLRRVFAAADVDSAIIFINKQEPSSVNIAEITEEAEVFSRTLRPSVFKPPGYVFQISLLKDKGSLKVIRKIELNSQPLARFCTVSTGLKAYQIGKGKPPQTNNEKRNRVFHATRKIDKTYGRYLDGVDVCRYALGWAGEYLSYGEWLAEPRKSVPFSGKRILVRQIPSKPPYLIQATLTDETAYNDINSMIVFGPVSHLSLKYLLGLINSRLLSFWFSKT
ncbi:MAG: N-6 DNA methylase, partial [bacterium]